MSEIPSAQELRNSSLTLYAFHRCTDISNGVEYVASQASNLWEQLIGANILFIEGGVNFDFFSLGGQFVGFTKQNCSQIVTDGDRLSADAATDLWHRPCLCQTIFRIG